MRISDWSSDVCSSDLACPASSPRRSRCRRSQSPVSSSALSRPPGIPTLRLRILRDSGKVSREALLGLDLHAAQDLDALRLRGARAVERFGEIADGVAAERHILDQSQDTLAIFDGNIVLALHIFRQDRPDRKS